MTDFDVEQVQQIVRERYDTPEDVRAHVVADEIGYSRWHFSRMYHRLTGQSFSDFVDEERLKAAAKLLLTTDFTCDQIADQVGYGSNASYFGRRFKKRYKASPEQYRKQKRAERPSFR